MADAKRTPTHVEAARKALATGKVVTVPAVAVAAPTKAEYDALRQTVLDLRDALASKGVVKSS